MKVKDCMCNDVCFCNTESSLEDVAKLMNTNHCGCIPVCDSNNSIVGIVTDRDIILRGVACSKDPKSTPVTDIMTTNVCTCTPDEEIANAESKMSNNQVRRIPVVDNGKVVGILTLSNLTNNDDIIGKEQAYRTIEKICNCDKNNNAE